MYLGRKISQKRIRNVTLDLIRNFRVLKWKAVNMYTNLNAVARIFSHFKSKTITKMRKKFCLLHLNLVTLYSGSQESTT